ncbi:hypothetical protein V8G54_001408 [Vigna mungo]|uniref:GST C-terminal domain-containing protein n=1 Tax=Vigna mungo TaxID=3915 RepID=A0AAQ3SBS5_VIGMU
MLNKAHTLCSKLMEFVKGKGNHLHQNVQLDQEVIGNGLDGQFIVESKTKIQGLKSDTEGLARSLHTMSSLLKDKSNPLTSKFQSECTMAGSLSLKAHCRRDASPPPSPNCRCHISTAQAEMLPFLCFGMSLSLFSGKGGRFFDGILMGVSVVLLVWSGRNWGSFVLFFVVHVACCDMLQCCFSLFPLARGLRLRNSLKIKMQRIQDWDPKFFTLAHIPEKYRVYVSKFIRQVVIARMSESHELAEDYHRKLREAYETEEKLKEVDVLRRGKEHLVRLLDKVERQLCETPFLAGQDFTMSDVMLIPVLARLKLLDLEKEYITGRPNIAEYWLLVQQRPNYKRVIGKYFNGWR